MRLRVDELLQEGGALRGHRVTPVHPRGRIDVLGGALRRAEAADDVRVVERVRAVCVLEVVVQQPEERARAVRQGEQCVREAEAEEVKVLVEVYARKWLRGGSLVLRRGGVAGRTTAWFSSMKMRLTTLVGGGLSAAHTGDAGGDVSASRGPCPARTAARSSPRRAVRRP